MGLFDIVGDIEVRQRKPRYDGEPNYKRCSFVRPKKVKGDVWEVVRQKPPQNFWDHPYWHYLSHEEQRYYLHRFHVYNEAPIFTEQVISPVQPEAPRFQRIEPRPHYAPRLIEPKYETIEPKKSKSKPKKKVRIETGHTIFDSDSDNGSTSSKSSFTTYKSGKSSRSSSSSSSASTFRPRTGL